MMAHCEKIGAFAGVSGKQIGQMNPMWWWTKVRRAEIPQELRERFELLAQLSPHFFEGPNATGGWRFAATILA
jgi:hypothetical protein